MVFMKKGSVILRAIILVIVLGMGGIFGCPFYQIFQIPCPCCGITRAWLAFFKGNVKGALSFHPFFMFISAILVLGVFEDIIFKSKKGKEIFFCVSGIIIFLLYLVRIKQGSIIF